MTSSLLSSPSSVDIWLHSGGQSAPTYHSAYFTLLPITVHCPLSTVLQLFFSFLFFSRLNHSAQPQLQARDRVPNQQHVVVFHHSDRPAGLTGHRLPSPGSKVTPGIAQARHRVQSLSFLPPQCSPTHQETGWLRSRRPTCPHHRQIRLESSQPCCR